MKNNSVVHKFAVIGDMGFANAQVWPTLRNLSNNGTYDYIMHVGDLAYKIFSLFT